MAAGFKDLHSFCFLGSSGRIGTAQDGIFAYVPAGPHKQFDMFLHSYQCYKKGLLEVQAAAVSLQFYAQPHFSRHCTALHDTQCCLPKHACCNEHALCTCTLTQAALAMPVRGAIMVEIVPPFRACVHPKQPWQLVERQICNGGSYALGCDRGADQH